MLGRKRYILVAVSALIGNIVFSGGFGIMAFLSYTAEEIKPAKLSIGVIACCFFLWRALKMIKYILRQITILKEEVE